MSKEFEFFIAGVQHHESHKVINDLKVDLMLDLKPEPTNKYDPNAVQIIYFNEDLSIFMLGYTPARLSPEVSAFLETADLPACIITELNLDKKPWERIKVVIRDLSASNGDTDSGCDPESFDEVDKVDVN